MSLLNYFDLLKNVSGFSVINRRPVGSVGLALYYYAGGRGFKPRPDQHSGSHTLIAKSRAWSSRCAGLIGLCATS